MNEIKVRQIVRNEIRSTLSEKKDEFQEFKYILTPSNLKAELRKIIQREFSGLINGAVEFHLKNTIRSEIKSEISVAIKEELRKQLQQVDIPKEVIDLFNKQFEKKFLPIVENIYLKVQKRHRNYLLKELRRMSTLKTSVIQEVSEKIRNLPVEELTEEKIRVEGGVLYLE